VKLRRAELGVFAQARPQSFCVEERAIGVFRLGESVAINDQLVAALPDAPPAIVPCYAAAYDPDSGNSYVLLQDLSATHMHPVTRDQQISITAAVPPADLIERVIDTLAQHHAYWWDHALLHGETFEIGYWSRNAERFGLYLQRRRTSWDSLVANEAAWFPDDLRDLYARVLDHLEQHWARYLEPRFSARAIFSAAS